jgi:hypothetical protein
LLLALLGCTLAFLRADVFFGHLHAVLLGQVFHRFDKGHAHVLHEEADGIAVFAATKAVVELFGGAHAEAGGFFAMEGAQPHEVGAALFELHVATHHLDHIGTGDQLLNKGLGDGHGQWNYVPYSYLSVGRAFGPKLLAHRSTGEQQETT